MCGPHILSTARHQSAVRNVDTYTYTYISHAHLRLQRHPSEIVFSCCFVKNFVYVKKFCLTTFLFLSKFFCFCPNFFVFVQFFLFLSKFFCFCQLFLFLSTFFCFCQFFCFCPTFFVICQLFSYPSGVRRTARTKGGGTTTICTTTICTTRTFGTINNISYKNDCHTHHINTGSMKHIGFFFRIMYTRRPDDKSVLACFFFQP